MRVAHRWFASFPLLVISVLAVYPGLARAGGPSRLYVDADAAGANDGSSWSAAFVYLQDALAAAAASGGTVNEIWVAAGTYKPDQGGGQTPGDRSATFQLLNAVALYGGFAGGETNLDERNIAANETILSGDLNGDDAPVPCTHDAPDCDSFGAYCVDGACVIALNQQNNAFSVVTGSATDGTAVIDGFTITAGYGGTEVSPYPQYFSILAGAGMVNKSGSPMVSTCTFTVNWAPYGGGIYNSGGTPAVTNCTFRENSGSYGGGINNSGGIPTVADCTFSMNSGTYGGGMYNGGSDASVTRCTFSENTSSEVGGGMYNASSNPTITDCTFTGNWASSGAGMGSNGGSDTVSRCTFTGNSAEFLGGGMYNNDSGATVTDSTFSDNSAGDKGGGIYHYSGSPSVTGCTFHGNSALNNGGAIYNFRSRPTVNRSVFRRNEAGFFGGGVFTGRGNITAINCIFAGNRASAHGGGMYNDWGTSTVVNCTFRGNSAGNHGGGVYNNSTDPSDIARVTNALFWANTDSSAMGYAAQIEPFDGNPVANYSIIEGGWSLGGSVGIVDADPLFVDADGQDDIFGTEDDDLRLMPGSPAIDAGDTTALLPDVADLDGDGDTAERTPLDLAANPRVLDDPTTPDTGVPGSAVVDMGAYEFLPDCNGNGLIDECDLDCLALEGSCNLPGCGQSADCNANGFPDECEQRQACCFGNGSCMEVPPDCCDVLGGVAVGPGTACLDGDNNGVDDTCGVSVACCTDHSSSTSLFCENHIYYDCLVIDRGRRFPPYSCGGLPDADGDDVPDPCDNCPMTVNPGQRDCNADGVGDACEPNSGDADSDADGVCDGLDGCPLDPAKAAPGVCGCGRRDTDSDGDGVADCLDQCPAGPDLDSDADGVPDCRDQCPGTPDVDTDLDTILDCADRCPGEDDRVDNNENNLPDCLEPRIIPVVSHWGLIALGLSLAALAKIRGRPRPRH